MNFAMLGWFFKLPGAGHLWFVTMIMSCYLLFVFLAKVNLSKNKQTWLLAVGCIVGQIIFEYLHLPGYFFLILFYCSIGFNYAISLEQFLNRTNFLPIALFALLMNIITFSLICRGDIMIGFLPYYYVTTLSGISMFAFLYKCFIRFKPSYITCFISAISYELYLVHHPLCVGPTNLFKPLCCAPVSIVLILCFSIMGAYLLSKIANFILKLQR